MTTRGVATIIIPNDVQEEGRPSPPRPGARIRLLQRGLEQAPRVCPTSTSCARPPTSSTRATRSPCWSAGRGERRGR
ncbi:hypothetical protein LV779_07175 [Streptomyces thinghirensis]|nr:hypothetical protein [Streptomyces thinghirensis]